ncbi:MAG TPA: hypothetical protein VGR89_04005, partial [Puia sp.]|nr:hypothetical protein [Puia sp.]
ATGIHFQNASIPAADDKLVDFIKVHTGKMKSLAAADLDFFLTTGRQLLNIGKPFYLEGIGTLIKNKEGYFDFTPGEYMVTRLDEPAQERRTAYEEPIRDREPKGTGTKQGMLLGLIIFGAAAIAWGGYYLYKRNSFTEPAEKRAVIVPETLPPADSSHSTVAKADTTKPQNAATNPSANPGSNSPANSGGNPAAAIPPANTTASTGSAAGSGEPVAQPGQTLYRFVILSTDNKHHALRRYDQLLGYQLNIKMDQKDSSWFKLYFPIAARPRDTTYIKDSLSDTYAAPHVVIEH